MEYHKALCLPSRVRLYNSCRENSRHALVSLVFTDIRLFGVGVVGAGSWRAFFASMSAFSLPGIQIWLGIQVRFIVLFCLSSSWAKDQIEVTSPTLSFAWLSSTVCIAVRESVQIAADVGVCRGCWSDPLMATSSACRMDAPLFSL